MLLRREDHRLLTWRLPEFGSFSCDEEVELEAVWLVLRLMMKWLLEVLEPLFVLGGMQLSLNKGNKKMGKKVRWSSRVRRN